MNNLKQLALGWLMYAGDNDDRMPPSAVVGSIDDLTGIEPSWVVGNALRDTSTTNLQRGLLFIYNNSVGIYRCPADKSTVTGKPGMPRTRTYALGALLNGTINGTLPEDPRWMKYKVSQLVNPSPAGVFTFIDSYLSIGASGPGFMIGVKEASGTDRWWGRPGEHHNRGANAAFGDGQARRFPWRFSRSKFDFSGSGIPVNAADRADFQLLKDHWPKP